ncbi:MAG: ATP-binding protein [Patescibacteria group bacterium]
MPNNFLFSISLSVLNHLGRNLYRSFTTVLGEAISNSWDADAQNVWVYINREANSFFIKDDGLGMTASDFQDKFLKIGYSKRRNGQNESPSGRPYIGRKGIGKLALLSCADKIHVISKVENGEYIGGIINNFELDDAITEDLTPQEYPLGNFNSDVFSEYTTNHQKGTIIYFENLRDGMKNSLEFLKKTVALYFRFSLLDSNFKIWINDELITHECLEELADKTEFLWEINNSPDPYIDYIKSKFTAERNEIKKIELGGGFNGFIASVEKPRNLKIISTDEHVSVDLFVNGRLRERDILKHIPTARIAESYLYGQIHFNELDDGTDRFTSSRESMVADDPKYKEMLETLRKEIVSVAIEDWDTWRRKHRKDGDSENTNVPKKERKSEELYNAISDEYVLAVGSPNKEKVEGWVDELGSDAKYNFASYGECFISENLVRKLIDDKSIVLTTEATEEINKWKIRETQNKANGGISIDLRKNNVDISYLDMKYLANLVDKTPGGQNPLPNDAKQYRPIRDALMHTSLLTDEAKRKLTTIYDNIKSRIKELLS